MSSVKSLILDIPSSVTEVVSQKIRDMIVHDEIHFGSQLSESHLAELFKISKTPVREALIRLSLQDRLVTIKPRSGYFVFSPSDQEIDDIGSARIVLEQGAIKIAMRRDRMAFLAALGRNVLEATKIYEEKGRGAVYKKLDFEFHGMFFKFAMNSCLDDAYRMISTKVLSMRNRLNFTSEFIGNSISGHVAILNCLSRGEVDAACAMLEQHIEASFTERARRTLNQV